MSRNVTFLPLHEVEEVDCNLTENLISQIIIKGIWIFTLAARGHSIVTHHLSCAPAWHQGPFHLLLPAGLQSILEECVAAQTHERPREHKQGRGQWRREVMSGPVVKDNNIMPFYRTQAVASASLSNWNGKQSEWRRTELALQAEWFTLSASCMTQMCTYLCLQHDIRCNMQVSSSLLQD